MNATEIARHHFDCEMKKKELREAGIRGEWDGELNRLNWQHCGLDCMLVRNANMLNWCGYVGLKPGHPYYGKSYDQVSELSEYGIRVHGGLTYSKACRETICHPDDSGGPPTWWLGFDCAHGMDVVPDMQKHYFQSGSSANAYARYRNQEYAKLETEALAEQLARVNQPAEEVKGYAK